MALEGWSHQTTRFDTGWKLEVWSGRFDRRPDSCRKECKKRTNAEGGMAARTRVHSENSGSNCSLSSTITALDPSLHYCHSLNRRRQALSDLQLCFPHLANSSFINEPSKRLALIGRDTLACAPFFPK